MITFSELGNMGHLGNQMFQYASLRGIASNNNLDWAIPSRQEFGSRYPLRSSIYDCFELESHTDKNIIVSQPTAVFPERHYHFDDSLYNNCPDGIDLNGYFQTEKYFEHIKDSIKKDFTFKKEIRERAEPLLENFDKKSTVIVHVRRTDYVGNDLHHFNIPPSYYSAVLNGINWKKDVIFISDDIEWCKLQPEFLNIPNVSFSSESPYVDLCLMTMCGTVIMANSSFSWWGAWLNENKDKTIIAPSKWFGPALQHSTKDLIPSDWFLV
jgi:hypothetical protein